MTDPFDGWRRVLQLAREGDPRYLFERLCEPIREHCTDEIDERGRRVWRFEYQPLPDDGDLRREIVEVLIARPWRSRRGRGRKAALHPADASALRFEKYMLCSEDWTTPPMTDKQARAELMRAYRLSKDTLDDVLQERNTYAMGHQAPKEPVRLARKNKT